MNWIILMIVGIAAIALIIFLMRQNQKDKKVMEKEMNYFEKPDEQEANDKDDGL